MNELKNICLLFSTSSRKQHSFCYEKCSKNSHPFFQDKKNLIQKLLLSCSYNGVDDHNLDVNNYNSDFLMFLRKLY